MRAIKRLSSSLFQFGGAKVFVSPWILYRALLLPHPRSLSTQTIKDMPQSHRSIVEGIFAINKPPSVSSAQVIRDLQKVFNPSDLFAPWLEVERAHRDRESNYQRKRRRDKRVQVKIGHGGTLDPMATGVLIMGVGKGTKQLQSFLECTKSYEATILFGAATDSYDTLGKVLRKAPHEHVDREKVEAALQKFRGKIMQRPPLYSALRMDGKRLYEYAREGKEIPREIEQRAVEVKELGIIQWLDGDSHDCRVPEAEAEAGSKHLAEKLLHLGEGADSVAAVKTGITENDVKAGTKRRRPLDNAEDEAVKNKKRAPTQEATDTITLMSGGLQSPIREDSFVGTKVSIPETLQTALANDDDCITPDPPRRPPPAVKLRMTVTSGFYVRSLAHDLGEAVGSLACMSALVRTRQGDYELGRNVLEYEDIDKGEDVWAPKVKALVEASDSEKTPVEAGGTNRQAIQGGVVEDAEKP